MTDRPTDRLTDWLTDSILTSYLRDTVPFHTTLRIAYTAVTSVTTVTKPAPIDKIPLDP